MFHKTYETNYQTINNMKSFVFIKTSGVYLHLQDNRDTDNDSFPMS